MREIAGILAFMSIVVIGAVILINEWIKKHRNNPD
jgi:Flp pilus assembly pilin Flp